MRMTWIGELGRKSNRTGLAGNEVDDERIRPKEVWRCFWTNQEIRCGLCFSLTRWTHLSHLSPDVIQVWASGSTVLLR